MGIPSGVVGGWIGYRLARWAAGPRPLNREACSGNVYQNVSKIEKLLGRDVWTGIEGRTVLDFGCGPGEEAVEMAQRGAKRVIGLDIQEKRLAEARQRAEAAGVADRCLFTTSVSEPVDVITSIDAFEHFDDPGGVLVQMRQLLAPGGRVLIAFGPSWFHPYGGHLFSVFPWAHLVFTERALIRWRSEFKHDGATRFNEVEGGLNGMTIRRFKRLAHESGFEIESFEPVPIRRLRFLSVGPAQECFTSIVRCRLRKAAG